MELERKKIGEVGVDSGSLVITDSCYIDAYWEKPAGEIDGLVDQTWEDDKIYPYSYEGVFDATCNKNRGGNLGKTLGVAFSTGYGDGLYEVYATYHDDDVFGRRIVKIEIEMGITPEKKAVLEEIERETGYTREGYKSKRFNPDTLNTIVK